MPMQNFIDASNSEMRFEKNSVGVGKKHRSSSIYPIMI